MTFVQGKAVAKAEATVVLPDDVGPERPMSKTSAVILAVWSWCGDVMGRDCKTAREAFYSKSTG